MSRFDTQLADLRKAVDTGVDNYMSLDFGFAAAAEFGSVVALSANLDTAVALLWECSIVLEARQFGPATPVAHLLGVVIVVIVGIGVVQGGIVAAVVHILENGPV
jgi:hypothetical protein